jgi:photosystem II stability/assembly factor-like uncharacterized protein
MSWELMSGDLTNTDPASPGGEDFGALSTIGLAASDSNVIYTGSEDGYVHVTFDHGGEWHRISHDLPIRYVTKIAVDPFDAMVAYVTISGFRNLDYLPHIFRTDNGGETWSDISGNLPEVPLNDVIVDPDNTSTLYVASDLGVWFTEDLGETWAPLGTNLPMTSYNDLELHQESRQLLAASFGLSMWVIDLEEEISGALEVDGAINDLVIFPNPVQDHATIKFALQNSSGIEIAVHDLSGKKIQTLMSQKTGAGEHSVVWKPKVSPGLYVISIRSSDFYSSRVVEVL